MKNKLLCAALFVAGLSSAHAVTTTWNFGYQGFVKQATGVFDPQMSYSGTFTGEDLNLDGVVALDELIHFESQGLRYLPKQIIIGGGGCGSRFLRCHVNYFSFALTGDLNYSVYSSGADEYYNRWWYSAAATGKYFLLGGGDTYSNQEWEDRYNWSDQTRFYVYASSVPEPTVALMLPAGLALLYQARARRRKLST